MEPPSGMRSKSGDSVIFRLPRQPSCNEVSRKEDQLVQDAKARFSGLCLREILTSIDNTKCVVWGHLNRNVTSMRPCGAKHRHGGGQKAESACEVSWILRTRDVFPTESEAAKMCRVVCVPPPRKRRRGVCAPLPRKRNKGAAPRSKDQGAHAGDT